MITTLGVHDRATGNELESVRFSTRSSFPDRSRDMQGLTQHSPFHMHLALQQSHGSGPLWDGATTAEAQLRRVEGCSFWLRWQNSGYTPRMASSSCCGFCVHDMFHAKWMGQSLRMT